MGPVWQPEKSQAEGIAAANRRTEPGREGDFRKEPEGLVNAMRMMLKARLDTDAANASIKSGTMPDAIKSAIDRLHPEAAYFMPEAGHRTCFLVFDMEDQSQIPSIAEPFFEELKAEIEIEPVMNLDDLQKGLATLRR
jgi:hypothetical protein